MVLVPLILLFLSLATSIHSLSAPECADGSTSVCKCGDGNPPDFSTFPPCDIKKVSIEARIYFTQPCSAGQAQVWVLRRWGPCFKVPQTKAKETLQSWQVQLLNLVKWTNVTLFTWRGPKFSKCISPNVDRSPCTLHIAHCTLHIAHCSGPPALTKPLLSVSNAPEEAAPPQRWDSRYPDRNIVILSELLITRLVAGRELSKMFCQQYFFEIFFAGRELSKIFCQQYLSKIFFCRQAAIQNVPRAPSSARMALHSCVWWTDRSRTQKPFLPEFLFCWFLPFGSFTPQNRRSKDVESTWELLLIKSFRIHSCRTLLSSLNIASHFPIHLSQPLPSIVRHRSLVERNWS